MLSEPSEQLLTRIRGEYTEMPGLRLTADQGCRLWGLERDTCEALLHALVDRGFLNVGPDGTYSRPSEVDDTLARRPSLIATGRSGGRIAR